MNIIANRNIIIALILWALVFSYTNAEGKEAVQDSTFRIMLDISVGYTASADTNFLSGGITPSLRLIWEPDHRLNIGFETGLLHIEHHSIEEKLYESGITDFYASLNAIPILAVFNMEVWKIDVYAGMGVSYVWTEIEAFDEKVISDDWNYCMMFSGGYTYMFTDWIGLGAEFKSYFFTKLDKRVGGLQLKLKWSLMKW
ncbi:hypothetical protein ACFLSQ_03235 [Bacteroidota bacterium]